VVEACEQERNLITLVRKHPALYNSRHPRFHDDTYKEQLWKRISSQLHIELTQCLVTWSELRYRYQRHVRRLRGFHRSVVQPGVPARRRPCLRHEEELLFLYPHVARFPLLTFEENDGETDGAPEVEIVEPPPVDIIDVDLVEDTSSCTREERRLIEAVSAYPQLYDSQHPQFSNFRHRGLIWSSISNELRDKATKLIKNWLKLQTRYEWEVRNKDNNGKESELYQLMSFMHSHVLHLPGTVCQASKYLRTAWHEPIENFRSVLALINAMRTMPELVLLTDDCQRLRTKPPIYDDLWREVGNAVCVSYERCEVTWLVLRSFHTQLTVMRKAGYQLQDKWYFENVLNGIIRLSSNHAAKRLNNNKRPHNGDAPGEMAPPPAKVTKPDPPRLPIAIVYPPSMKNRTSNSISSTSGGGNGQSLPNARSSSGKPAATSSSGKPAATSSSSRTAPEILMPSFVIPTAQGNVRVSAVHVPPAQPQATVTASQAPTPIASFGQRPNLQISMGPKINTPLPSPVPITIPTAMIRAMPPPPAAAAAAAQAAKMERNGSISSMGSSISVRRVQPVAAKLPKLAPKIPLNVVANNKSSEMTVPMVRIHQPVQQSEIDIGGAGTSAGMGKGTKVGSGALAGAAKIYPEMATTSSGSRAPPKAPAPILIKTSGKSLPAVAVPVTATNRIGISTASDAITEILVVTLENASGTPVTPAAAPVTPAAAPVTPAAPPVTPAAASVIPAAAPVIPAAAPVIPAAAPLTLAAPPASPVARAASPVAREASPVARAASPGITAAPLIDLDDIPSTSKSIPTDFGQSPPGIYMSAINVNVVNSASAGNSLRIWGGGLNCNYHLNMARTATFIREVMAVPQLHNKNPQIRAQADEFWQTISQKFHMPEVALRACWNFLANNMSFFPSIAPMSELMRPFKTNVKVWEKSNRLFSKFDEIARKYNWIKHRMVIPDLIRHFRQHEHLYWEMRSSRPGEPPQSPPLCTEKERQEVWRQAKIKFPDLDHHNIWSMFKFAFRTYMEDLECGIENSWPQDWWQALEELKYLADVRYHPLEPYYYIVHNKIHEEAKRCSIVEAMTSSDLYVKDQISAIMAPVVKEPMPWCSDEAKRLLTGKLNSHGKVNNAIAPSQAPETVPVVPVIDFEAGENFASPDTATKGLVLTEPEPEPVPQPSTPKRLVKLPPIASGSRPPFTLPTIEVFELTRMLRRYPHTFQRVHTISKRTAWVRVSKDLKITVTECRLGLQYALREMRLLKILDPNNLCTMNHKYQRHTEEIFKQVKNKSQLTVRTPEQMNESVIVEPPEEVMPYKFVPEINISNCKPSLVLKNWSAAIANLPSESQDILGYKLKILFAKYAR
ncbi:hypothetical protein KR032_011744, partial [Drosophila birchii]